VEDQEATLRADVQAIQSWPFLQGDVVVGGFVYDVDTGQLRRVC
jgi:carbonic anhydrase